MKTKKCGAYAALAAVLLITAMLVLTCVDPITPGGITVPKGGEEFTFTPPPGKGYISVVVPTTAARTILPTAPDTLYYKVDITGTGSTSGSYGNSAGDGTVDFTTDHKETFVVDPGTYSVTVGAYTTAAFTTGTLIAVGTANATPVSTGTPGAATVTLEGILDSGTTQGKFTYNIILPDPVPETAEISIVPYAGGSALTITEPDLLEDNTGTETIGSGYYWVKISMTKARYAPVVYTYILHVYGNQTSDFTNDGVALPSLRKITYDVTYNQNYSGKPTDVVDDKGGDGWPHAQTITKNAAFSTNPTRSGYTFDDWFKVPSPTLTGDTPDVAWIFGPSGDLIYRDTILYANWTLNSGLVITIHPYIHPTDPLFDVSGLAATYTQAAAISGLSLNIEVALDDGATTDAVIYFDAVVGWKYNDKVVIANSNILTTAGIAAYNALGTTAADDKIDLTQIGPHVFTFVGTKDTKDYSGTVTINIVQ